MSNIHPSVVITTHIVAKDMTTDELVAINLAVQLGVNPRGVMGYEKAKSLFTEQNQTIMHRDTRTAFAAIVNERIAGESDK